jgi:hypothetical protein
MKTTTALIKKGRPLGRYSLFALLEGVLGQSVTGRVQALLYLSFCARRVSNIPQCMSAPAEKRRARGVSAKPREPGRFSSTYPPCESAGRCLSLRTLLMVWVMWMQSVHVSFALIGRIEQIARKSPSKTSWAHFTILKMLRNPWMK